MAEGRNNPTWNNNNNNYNYYSKRKERCLTMHQPWASLLVHGIKRIEGRSWPSPLTGRLWIHAAGKVPDHATVKTMEDFYREIYAWDGITDLEFPKQYPVSRLIGCIEVVGCLRRKELACWNEVPEGVRLQALTDFCWLCEHPQRLSVPLEMRGWRGVYDLDSQINEASIGSLIRVETPLQLKFPLPNPQDPFSLKPGSLSSHQLEPEVEKSPQLTAIVNAASQAATQFSNKGQNSNAFQAATQFSNKGQNSNAFQAASQFSNKGQNSKSNDFGNRSRGNFTRPEDGRFVRNNQYTENYRFDSGNHGYSTRPAVTRHYVKREQNMGSNGFRSGNQRDLYTSTSTQFVRSGQIDGNNSLGNDLRTKCRIENEENCKDYRSTPQIFASAVKGIRPAPRMD